MNPHSFPLLPVEKRQSVGGGIQSFILPMRHERTFFAYDERRVCAILPTYKPSVLTEKLVRDLARWNPQMTICVVDDCTPRTYKEGRKIFKRIASVSERVIMLRTPENTLKAGALNYALSRMLSGPSGYAFDVVMSLDDDIVIAPETVRNLAVELMSHESLGAVCSECRVLNKNANILTRLQGLEYLGFNATRLSDEGFYWGPLVMHGMLTAFRATALREVGYFAERHLIEDYEITTRLKESGWSVKLVVNAPAWTVVPRRFSELWRQRARWTYGGITIVSKTRRPLTVLQDLIGHGVFFATVLIICSLLVFEGGSGVSPAITNTILALSLFHLVLWIGFQFWLMQRYEDRDARDWLLRLSLVPEFIYANALTLVLIGSYLFLFFKILTRGVPQKGAHILRRLIEIGDAGFRKLGYSEGWGTRAHGRV